MHAKTSSAASSAAQAASASQGSYRTLWRWHFYAGLFVMPFLIVLAITGTIYCFQPQIEPLLYRQQMVVAPRTTPRLPPDQLMHDARAAVPHGAVISTVHVLDDPSRSAEFVFKLPSGEKESVYLNPYTGAVLGTLSVENRFIQLDRMVHRKLLLGKAGELLMELAACWTLVMIGTGVALWWPRTKTTARDALLPRLSLTGRPLWKNVHAVMGIWLAFGALFFVVTGLPWSGSWGKNFNALATSANIGTPAGAWGGLPLQSSVPGKASVATASNNAGEHRHDAGNGDSMPGMVMSDLPLTQTPWAVTNAAVPESHAAEGARLPLQRVMDIAASLGVGSGYEIVVPSTATGVYTVSWFPADPKLERTLYVDQYSGAVLKDIRYRDYGAVAQAVSYGTSLHMGRYFGFWNQLACASISLSLAAMAVTGFVMWWKRRPQRTLGAPARERLAPPMRAWKTGLALLGIVFPLMGLTMLAVWLMDRLMFDRAFRRIAS
ncbi:PepSY domain-containing protein [Caballeronia sp. GAWG2-1]|uniref:PepSY-associated TM helix domain-containing protein n=1 Tax=Caballeronia sp. GAWG2-1 TaxID=2921744 RepID=UPI002028746C|nr:PepSY domain-containing protein [Caballeronia sp. GAWG2-1]